MKRLGINLGLNRAVMALALLLAAVAAQSPFF